MLQRINYIFASSCFLTSHYIVDKCASIDTSIRPRLCQLRLTRPYGAVSEGNSAMTTDRGDPSAGVVRSQDAFCIDDVVEVARRAWVGINKPGGVGKIISIVEEDGRCLYGVKYALGGREKGIEKRYISYYNLNKDNKRDTIGRCRFTPHKVMHSYVLRSDQCFISLQTTWLHFIHQRLWPYAAWRGVRASNDSYIRRKGKEKNESAR